MGRGKERRETESQTNDGTEQMSALQSGRHGCAHSIYGRHHGHHATMRAAWPGAGWSSPPLPGRPAPPPGAGGVGGEACTSRYQAGWE